ncbi:uncharacterized protein BDR25DRAFT_353278 [Lindgomyces ingoldianus]|uniref:Uncharacterized protein n=1 Tax=Lindgomyces ingoldianus TaxID=673940 RepID=A0ACB6R3F7_9PLEO|nr:uncharacterized protein BDR25DRAFT_353278 [Lindgomyces ingoldianus]KAF2472971.1 hypothetical protein BDR25DRAFT_353278 [Lindgomyces ingoldianus]
MGGELPFGMDIELTRMLLIFNIHFLFHCDGGTVRENLGTGPRADQLQTVDECNTMNASSFYFLNYGGAFNLLSLPQQLPESRLTFKYQTSFALFSPFIHFVSTQLALSWHSPYVYPEVFWFKSTPCIIHNPEPSTPPSPTGIAELREEFSNLLELDRFKPRRAPKSNPIISATMAGANPGDRTVRPRSWKASFRFLDLPTELQDLILMLAVYEPKGVIYCRRKAHSQDYWGKPKEDYIDISLFLVSRRIYAEALRAFCCHNRISITYKTSLTNTLRLFPDAAGKLVHRIRLTYDSVGYMYGWNTETAMGAWTKMINDAREAKEHFPLLKECMASWFMNDIGWEGQGVQINDGSVPVETKILQFVGWMRRSADIMPSTPPPPRWLTVQFRTRFGPQVLASRALTTMEYLFGEALERYKKEVKEPENVGERELEESGRKWLEEEWAVEEKRARLVVGIPEQALPKLHMSRLSQDALLSLKISFTEPHDQFLWVSTYTLLSDEPLILRMAGGLQFHTKLSSRLYKIKINALQMTRRKAEKSTLGAPAFRKTESHGWKW